jgi:hypothetical protein
MRLHDWLEGFCKLHERAGRGQLTAEERIAYVEDRDELARALLASQRISLYRGQTPRHSLRAALAFPVVLQMKSGRVLSLTQDISAGGFSVILAVATGNEQAVPFTLRLGRDAPPIEGKAHMVGGPGMGGGTGRVGFAFDEISPEGVERIEQAVFNSVVVQLMR